MTGGDSTITALIQAARAEFAAGLEAKARTIEALVGAEAWEEAQRAAHKLRGSAGIHGFATLGTLAGALEEAIRDIGGERDSAARGEMRNKVNELVAEAERATRGGP